MKNSASAFNYWDDFNFGKDMLRIFVLLAVPACIFPGLTGICKILAKLGNFLKNAK